MAEPTLAQPDVVGALAGNDVPACGLAEVRGTQATLGLQRCAPDDLKLCSPKVRIHSPQSEDPNFWLGSEEGPWACA